MRIDERVLMLRMFCGHQGRDWQAVQHGKLPRPTPKNHMRYYGHCVWNRGGTDMGFFLVSGFSAAGYSAKFSIRLLSYRGNFQVIIDLRS